VGNYVDLCDRGARSPGLERNLCTICGGKVRRDKYGDFRVVLFMDIRSIYTSFSHGSWIPADGPNERYIYASTTVDTGEECKIEDRQGYSSAC
jgi:hypothetical protein